MSAQPCCPQLRWVVLATEAERACLGLLQAGDEAELAWLRVEASLVQCGGLPT